MRIISVIMGPTFSGKTTYLNKQWIKDRFGHHIIAHTTRPSREDEEDGIDYYFDSFLSDSYQRICVRQYKVANGDIWSYWINKNDILDNRNNYIILDILVLMKFMKCLMMMKILRLLAFIWQHH